MLELADTTQKTLKEFLFYFLCTGAEVKPIQFKIVLPGIQGNWTSETRRKAILLHDRILHK